MITAQVGDAWCNLQVVACLCSSVPLRALSLSLLLSLPSPVQPIRGVLALCDLVHALVCHLLQCTAAAMRYVRTYILMFGAYQLLLYPVKMLLSSSFTAGLTQQFEFGAIIIGTLARLQDVEGSSVSGVPEAVSKVCM